MAAPGKRIPTKDAVVIDQKEYQLFGEQASVASKRCSKVRIIVSAEATLVSQERAFLRAAINLDGPELFRPVFVKEVPKGSKTHEIQLEVAPLKEKTIRVVIWLDPSRESMPPKPLAIDNIAFDARPFLNVYDR